MISPERQSHLSHLIVDHLWGNEWLDFEDDDEGQVLKVVKLAIQQCVSDFQSLETAAEEKILSGAKAPERGSQEWEKRRRQNIESELEVKIDQFKNGVKE